MNEPYCQRRQTDKDNLQDGILPPWQPESYKPALPFVICTNGEGHYWIGSYDLDPVRPDWKMGTYYGWDSTINPLAWIEPEKFVPFVKARELHKCENHEWHLSENMMGSMVLHHKPTEVFLVCKNCPFCGYKAGEK